MVTSLSIFMSEKFSSGTINPKQQTNQPTGPSLPEIAYEVFPNTGASFWSVMATLNVCVAVACPSDAVIVMT